jgi:hypothetical protein
MVSMSNQPIIDEISNLHMGTYVNGRELSRFQETTSCIGAHYHRRNHFVCNAGIGGWGIKTSERCFRRSAFEAGFKGVELESKVCQRKLKVIQLFYAGIAIHGSQSSLQNGELDQLRTSVRQYRDERIPQRKGTAPAPQRNGPSAGRGRKSGYYQSTGAVPMLEPTRTENVPQGPPGRTQKS